MSTLTTTTVNTNSTTTNLTLMTGNNSASKIVVGATGEGIILSGNSSINSLVINSTGISSNVTTTFSNVVVNSVNATTINLLGSSISTTGYTRLPNGLLLQWGTVVANTVSGAITYPIAFAANPYSVILTGGVSVTSVGYVNAVSTTTASIRSTSTANPASSLYYWLALGV